MKRIGRPSVISCEGRYSHSSDTVIARVIGYNKESIAVLFLTGEGATAHELAKKRWRTLSRSIKFDQITDVKRIEKKDLPMYLACNTLHRNSKRH